MICPYCLEEAGGIKVSGDDFLHFCHDCDKVLEGEWKTYGTNKTFETEGDMYEHITGHRSAVLDGGEKK